ncbi:MAG: ABC transporter substrate-binding protein [Myxococcales bacterium]|nr:ABC transporter substrate-binding protein [Myxococcales bacterium]
MRVLFALVLSLAGPSFAASAKDEVSKPLKAVINSVRYGKDRAALKHFAGEEQGKELLAEEWAKGTEAQRKEFLELFHTLFAKMAFPKIRKNFEHLDTVLYEEPSVSGNRAELASTILIDHPVKKQELKLKYRLLKDKSGWKVIDVSVLGDSMLKGIREDQVGPIMKEGGWQELLKLTRAKAKELESVPLK